MEKTEKFRMRKYFVNTGTNIYAARGVNNQNFEAVSTLDTKIEVQKRKYQTSDFVKIWW